MVGIDISKAFLDVAVVPGGKFWRENNDGAGIDRVVKEVEGIGANLVIVEATGGMEAPVVGRLAEALQPVVVANPRQVRDFARATGKLAKTDRIDAGVLAAFGAAVKPTPRRLREADEEELRALMVRRRQVVEMLVAEKNRLRMASRMVRPKVMAHVEWLEQEQKDLDRELRDFIKASPIWQAKSQLLRSTPGVGPLMTAGILAWMPELGSLNRHEVAALAGVAPFNRDSGTMRGKRVVWGGRKEFRRLLYMAAVTSIRHNPQLGVFYRRLRAAGKPGKVALTAVMRKLIVTLNTMVRTGVPWQPAMGS